MVRNKTIDYIKGICIILVVMGHAWAPFLNFISLFHMAVFIIISGYCWNSEKIKNFKDLINYTVKKIRTLYIPFVLFNVSCLLLNNFCIKINFYTNNSNLLSWEDSGLVVTKFLELKNYLGFTDILKSILKIMLFTGETQFGGATWFLRTLFLVSIFHASFELVLKKYPKSKKYIFIILNLFCIIISQIISQYNLHLHFGMQNIFIAYYCYSIGILMKKINLIDNKILNKKLINVCSLIFSFIIMFILSKSYSISFVDCKIINIFLFTLTSILGLLFLFSITKLFDFLKNIFCYLGKRTMPIFLFHFLSFKIVTYIYLMYKNLPVYLLSAFPCLVDKYLWIFYTIIGVLVPIIVYELYAIVKKEVENKCKMKIKLLKQE